MDVYQQEVLSNLIERLQNSKYKYNQVLTSSQLVGIAIKGKSHLRKILGSYPSGKDRLRRYGSVAINHLCNEGVLQHISHRTYLFKSLPASTTSNSQPSAQCFDLFSNTAEENVDMYDHVEVSEQEVEEADLLLYEVLDDLLEPQEEVETTLEDDIGILGNLVNNKALSEIMDVLERHTVNLSEVTEIAKQALTRYEARKDKPVSITLDAIKDQLEQIAEVSAKINRIKSHFA